jgi:malonyl-ACP O-methyltransferase BioC
MQADKTIIQKRFGKKLSSYHQEAVVQKAIARKLADACLPHLHEPLEKVLEIGCGSGFLTKEILSKFSIHNLILNDIAESAQTETGKVLNKFPAVPQRFILGDAEQIDFPDNLDAIFSGSCIQWFSRLKEFFQKSHKLLNQDGMLALSSFGEYNFQEIKHTLNIGLNYLTLPEHLALLEGDFEIIEAVEWTESVSFEQPIEVLRHIQQTGTNAVNDKPFSKGKLKKFTEDYQLLFANADNSVRLTYHPLIILAKKK